MKVKTLNKIYKKISRDIMPMRSAGTIIPHKKRKLVEKYKEAESMLEVSEYLRGDYL